MTSISDDYLQRFRRVLAHVDANAADDLSVERLANVAAFSPHHFHRQFAALFGVNASKLVQLVRFRRAAYELAFRAQQRTILEIALDAGYESHEAFSRAFKRLVGQSPSDFRQRPDWGPFDAVNQRLTEVRAKHMKPAFRGEDVSIVEFPRTRIAVLTHLGDPKTIGDTIRRFIAWRKASGFVPNASATFNLLYADPGQVAPEAWRLDLCASIDRAIAPNDDGVVEREIPAGRCAKLRHVGSDDTLGEAFRFLYGEWLPASGEEPRDFPLFVERVSFFPEVAEHEAVKDIFVPLK